VLSVAADNVEIDLNGLKVEGDADIFAADVILVNGAQAVTVENGIVVGGGAGVRLASGSSQFSLRRLVLRGGRTGIGVASGSTHGIIEDNIVQDASDDGISVSGTGVRIRGNVISASINGIVVESCSACLISENSVQNPVVNGISINQGTGNLVLRNTISSAGTGIRVTQGGFHQIESNVLTDNSKFGLHLVSTSFQNVYRANTARSNGGTGCTNPSGNADFCDEGAGNTSHGDNYMPDKR